MLAMFLLAVMVLMASLRGLRATLADLRERLSLNRRRLARAQKRFQARRKDAYRHHVLGIRLGDRADQVRAAGQPVAASRIERQSQRAHRRAYKQHQKTQWWLGRIKLLQQRIHRLDLRVEEIEEEIAREKKVRLENGRLVGGTAKARYRQACLRSWQRCASGKRRNFYSQPGHWSYKHCLTGEPVGFRSDCSQWLTSVCWLAQVPDPNGADWTGGYTGTQAGGHNGWRLATEAEMRKSGWGYVIYGSGEGYHVEAYVGPGNRTIGHGSAPIDPGVIDLFGRGDYRCYIYDLS